MTIRRILAGKFGTCAGQACIGIDYILVEKKFESTLVRIIPHYGMHLFQELQIFLVLYRTSIFWSWFYFLISNFSGSTNEGVHQETVWRRPQRDQQYCKDNQQKSLDEIEKSFRWASGKSFHCVWWLNRWRSPVSIKFLCSLNCRRNSYFGWPLVQMKRVLLKNGEVFCNLIYFCMIYFCTYHVPQCRFIEPTILVDPPLKAAIMNEEIFGPLLPIITVSNIYVFL